MAMEINAKELTDHVSFMKLMLGIESNLGFAASSGKWNLKCDIRADFVAKVLDELKLKGFFVTVEETNNRSSYITINISWKPKEGESLYYIHEYPNPD